MSKNTIIPQSWRNSLGELREDIVNTVDHWISRLKPGERDAVKKELELEFWQQPLSQLSNLPKIDLNEEVDTIHITAELPGLRKEDLSVQLDGQLLTLSGYKESHREEKRAHALLSECRFGSFSRTITLPCEVDRDRIKAKCRNGVLKLTLPKTEDAKARQIKIQYEN